MKKTLILVALFISTLSFYSCDNSALSKATGQQATEALALTLAAQVSASLAYTLGTTLEGVAVSADDTQAITYTFTSYDVSGSDVGSYTSLSGTIDVADTTSTYDISFSGGEVVTLYMVLNASGATAFEVNGHDMLDEVTITATH